MRKVLVYGLYDWNNLGDDLMMFSINRKLIDENIEPYFIKSHGDNYFKFEKNYDSILFLDKKYNNKLINGVSKILQLIKFLFKKNEYDSIIFMGGGYINRSIGTGYGRLIYIYILKSIFSLKHKKVYFTGQTAGPINNYLERFLIKKIYKNSNVYVRENYSYSLMTEVLNIVPKLTGDDAYLIKNIIKKNKSLKSNKYMIVNYKDFFGYDAIYDKYIDLIKKVAKEKNLSVILVPFRNKENYTEYSIHKKINEELIKSNINSSIFNTESIDELINCFANAEFVIGTAYHCVVLSLIYGKKVYCGYIGEYYKAKVGGILDLYSIKENCCYDLEVNSSFENIYDEVLNNTIDYNNINNITNKIHKEVENEWNDICKAIGE